MKNFIKIVGARPNFMKAAPVLEAFQKYTNIEQILVHIDQHYDNKTSDGLVGESIVKVTHGVLFS